MSGLMSAQTIKPSVLLIEDEPLLARNILIFLTREGLGAQMAASGEGGLQLLESFVPDVVLVDYNLPGINGLEVLARIRRQAPHARVVMITGTGSEEVAMEALRGGAADYLKKPIELVALRGVIERVFERR